jgi:hypothetical protein
MDREAEVLKAKVRKKKAEKNELASSSEVSIKSTHIDKLRASCGTKCGL